MALFQSLESRYGKTVELNQALQGILAGSWDEKYTYITVKNLLVATIKSNQDAAKEGKQALNQLKKQYSLAQKAYEAYWQEKKKTWFFKEWFSYWYWSTSPLRYHRNILKQQLAKLEKTHNTIYQTITMKMGIGTSGLSYRSSTPISLNKKKDIDYCISRYRNNDPNYQHYGTYYRRQIALVEIKYRFFTNKIDYFYMGTLWFFGLLGVGLAVAALFWPPAMALLIGGKVGLMAIKFISILLLLPLFYGASAFLQGFREQLYGKDCTRADRHSNHALSLDVLATTVTLIATVLPLFYIMTLPHGHLIAAIIVGSFSALTAIQATMALLDSNHRINYMASGFLSPVGQGKEAINLKRSLWSIFSFSAEHRRHFVKFLLNPAEWLCAAVNTLQSLMLRICEIGAVQGEKSHLLRFKSKQNIILVLDFFLSPVRLFAFVVDSALRFMDFTHEKAIENLYDMKNHEDTSNHDDNEIIIISEVKELTDDKKDDNSPLVLGEQSSPSFRWLFDSSQPYSLVNMNNSSNTGIQFKK
ncbi:MAG: hypothetical protein ACX932_06835 [Gammaproteobacteria bacterium]